MSLIYSIKQSVITDTPLQKKAIKIQRSKLSKRTVNVFRTTQRNNIDLTAIADNKASVLLSLNALMITVMAPMLISNSDLILEKSLVIPLLILGVTCLTTMYLAARVLKPSYFENVGFREGAENAPSPFFFGNFYRMEPDDFYSFIEDNISDEDLLKSHLIQDLYFVGRRLGFKMTQIKMAFNIFIGGVFLTFLSTVFVLTFL